LIFSCCKFSFRYR